MGKHSGQEGSAGRAFDELGGTREQSENDAGEWSVGKDAASDLDEKVRAAGDGAAILLRFNIVRGEFIQTADGAEVLNDEGFEAFGGELFEVMVQTVRKRFDAEAGLGRPLFESDFSEGEFWIEPLLAELCQNIDQTFSRLRGEEFLTVTLQCVAGVRNELRGECGM